MAGNTSADQRFSSLEESFWNKARPRQILARLEQHQAFPALREDISRKFLAGQHGDAELRAAVCCELLRNADPKALLKRVADLRSRFDTIQHELFSAISEIKQLKSWEAHRDLGYEDWTEFSERVLGLSGQIAEALLLAREEVPRINPNQFFQALIKGCAAPIISQEDLVLTVEELLQRKSDPKLIIKELKAQKEWIEFRLGEQIRATKAAEEEAVRVRAEQYRKVQKKDALIDKLCRNMEPQTVNPSDDPAPNAKSVTHKEIRKAHHPQNRKESDKKKQ